MNTKEKTASSKAKNQQTDKKRHSMKDYVITALILACLGVIAYSRFGNLPVDQWTGEMIGFVGDIAIYFLGIVGTFEFCYDNGALPFIPDWFIAHKEESARKQTKEYLQEFFDKESEFLEAHEEDRLADVLSMMGLSAQGYQSAKAKVLEARLAPIHNVETARQKMLDLIFYSDVVYDLRSDASYVKMGGLSYYFKFHDLMHDRNQSDAVAQAMATFISLTCEQEGINLADIDVIMVPHSSNFLLGLKVSKLLSKRFIKMIPEKHRIGKFSYEGVIPTKHSKKTVDVLILHDVLLSGQQIFESADALIESVPNCTIHGLFSAVYRNVRDGKGVLEHGHNIRCYSLLDLTEEEIERELKKRGKA